MANNSLRFVFLFVWFTIFFDFSIGNFYEYFYFSEKSKKIDRLIHSTIGTSESVLFFGSSRAYHHYNPAIFEKKLGMTCFNVGYGGQNIYYHLALLKSSLQLNKPKIVILDLFYIDFQLTGKENDMEKLGVLLPFVNSSNIYKDAVLKRGWTENIKLLSSIYPFNSKILHIIRNNISNRRTDYNGYVGLNKNWDKNIGSHSYSSYKLDSNKLNAIFEFIDLCNKNNICLVLNVSPSYYLHNGNSIYNGLNKIIKNKYNISINNYEINPAFNDASYFADPFHLNVSGSDLFSTIVADYIIRNCLN